MLELPWDFIGLHDNDQDLLESFHNDESKEELNGLWQSDKISLESAILDGYTSILTLSANIELDPNEHGDHDQEENSQHEHVGLQSLAALLMINDWVILHAKVQIFHLFLRIQTLFEIVGKVHSYEIVILT